jgi:hypothetical protein
MASRRATSRRGSVITKKARTPGVQVLDGATAILGRKSEPQPDVSLRIRPEYGGQTRTSRGFVEGAPELVAEVAKATRYIDLGPKRDDYERAGVQEYIVRAHNPDELIWYILGRRRLVKLLAGAEGLYRSEVFPGLWLDPRALLANDLAGMLAALDKGLATPAHTAFVAKLPRAGAQKAVAALVLLTAGTTAARRCGAAS